MIERMETTCTHPTIIATLGEPMCGDCGATLPQGTAVAQPQPTRPAQYVSDVELERFVATYAEARRRRLI